MHPIDKIQGAEEEKPRIRKADPSQYMKTQIPQKKSQAPNNRNNKKNMKGAKKLKILDIQPTLQQPCYQLHREVV
jgi:hypothetical protein